MGRLGFICLCALLVGCGGGDKATGAGGAAASGGQGGAGGSGGGGGQGGAEPEPPRVLLFTRATGFVHDSIEPAADALSQLGEERGWQLSRSDNPAMFTRTGLADFDVVVWVLTSGDVLDDTQQAAFESFIRSGGGYAGIHSASDTEYDWPFYGELVGAYFSGHPAVQPATIRVEQPGHPSGAYLDSAWSRTDEWYSFTLNPRSEAVVLLSLDEQSYNVGGFAMGDHPIAWYHGHEGGRAFYTALGHTIESWSEAALLQHVAGGIEWAAGTPWPRAVLTEFDDAVSPNGTWERHQPPEDFPFEVTPQALTMQDTTGANQHLVRRGVAVDPNRPYGVEATFVIPVVSGPLNSFCLNLNLAGADDDLSSVSSWAMNVDLSPGGPGGVMKHMGFVAGAFNSIGETPISWGEAGQEYTLRVFVNADAQRQPAPNLVTVTVLHEGVIEEQFSVDYSSFPYQPDLSQPVRVGANTHGADWSLRNYRVYYLDD